MELNKAGKDALFSEINRGVVSHAYIIEGVAGTGKRSFASAAAAAILCSGAVKPCGVCLSCRKCKEGTHPDLHRYGTEGNSFKVEAVRDIKRSVTLTPNDGDRAVYILEKADTMTVSAQNALLKVFEEPPRGTTFFLLTEKHEALLPTVRSRGRLIRLSPLSEEDLFSVLKETHPKTDEAELREAARIAEGSLGKAEAVLKKEGKTERDSALKLCTAIYGNGDRYSLYSAFLGQMRKRDALIPIIDALAVAARDVLVSKLGAGKSTLLKDEQAAAFAEGATSASLYAVVEAVLECSRSLRRNTDPGIAVSELCTRINRAKG